MDRETLIQQLDQVRYNIKLTERFMAQPIPYYYSEFGHLSRWQHKLKIWAKCLAYWKRRFNRILNELRYEN